MNKPAILVLEDGSVFHGCSIGQDGHTVGEVVFNTSMTGYQEILTDPSYAEQIVTLTYPHIGNVGTNSDDEEASKIWAKGLIIRELSKVASNWRSKMPLQDYLKQNNIVAISNLDTRRLTRLLREKGAMRGCITTELDIEKALSKAKSFPDMNGLDLAKVVSVLKPYQWSESSWSLEHGIHPIPKEQQKFHVVAYDYGVKLNILRLLADRDCRITVVPAKMSAKEALALKPDGIFLSNGPGDPAACDYAIDAIKEFLDAKIPLFGICLGYQLLALASGAETRKMKFGHHGANHPVKDLRNNTVLITSQNHGFAVEESTLPEQLEITHRSLFDNTLQGIRRKDRPAFGFQGHPEASPGPHDVAMLFDEFITLMQ